MDLSVSEMSTYSVIDVFSGAGGMTLGFVDERFAGGFRSVWAIDNDPTAIESYTRNFGEHAECDDIEERLARGSVPQADAVIGGPPCQGFSLLNKNKRGDGRRRLWEPFMDVVARSSCRVFAIENVRWLHNSVELAMIRARAEALGFKVHAGVFNTADYGVPQARHRALVLGVKRRAGARPDFPFSPTISSFADRKSRSPNRSATRCRRCSPGWWPKRSGVGWRIKTRHR